MMEGPQIAPALSLLVFFFFFLIAVAASVLLTVLPFWKICSKAGFPGALSLLMLIPIGNIILLFYLAFAEWPALRQMRTSQSSMSQGPASVT
jgi:hypothetical protein